MDSKDTLGYHLRYFLVDYLPRQRDASSHTIKAYRDSLKLLLLHVSKARKSNVGDLSLENLNREAVLLFLESVERDRGNGAATRNLRLTAIRSLFRAVAQISPEHVQQAQQILSIPQKRTDTCAIEYLTVSEVEALLKQPSLTTREGRRDDALLRFLYNTGARVQEVVDIRPKDIRVDAPGHVRLFGKGRKERVCPLWPQTIECVQRTLQDRDVAPDTDTPVFTNRKQAQLTRYGVRYILAKYVRLAARDCASIQKKKIHPHTMRHTTAMHLLQSGVDLNTIRCWLGHSDLATTNLYVEADLEMKRRALAETEEPPRRREAIVNKSLLTWLEAL